MNTHIHLPASGILLVHLLGCQAPDPTGSVAAEDPSITDLSVDLDPEYPTLAVARWTSPEPASGRMHLRVDGEERVTLWDAELTTDHEATILGLPAGSTVELWAEEEQDGVMVLSAIQTVETGSPPPELPIIDAVMEGGDVGGFFAVPVLYAVQGGVPETEDSGAVVLLDGRGRLVWWKLMPGEQPSAAALSKDGEALWVLSYELLTRIPLDGSPVTEIDIPKANHDLLELPDGSVAVMGEDTIYDEQGQPWACSTIVEVHPDGTQEVTWHIRDHFDELGLVVGEGRVWGVGEFDHANALTWVPETDEWLIGVTGIGGILRVDRATGATDWWVGRTPAATMRLDAPADYLMHHRFDLQGTNLLWFVNQVEGSTCSRIARLELDEEGGVATEVGEYAPDVCRTSFMLGQVQRLPGKRILANWSTAGVLDLLDEDFALAASFEGQLGYGFGYSDWVPDPTLAVAP